MRRSAIRRFIGHAATKTDLENYRQQIATARRSFNVSGRRFALQPMHMIFIQDILQDIIVTQVTNPSGLHCDADPKVAGDELHILGAVSCTLPY